MRAILTVLTTALLLFLAGVASVHAQARMELTPSVSFSTAYDDNIFTTEQASGDTMMYVTPAFEARYESPTTIMRGIASLDMQRAVGFSTLNSLDAKRHAMVNTEFQLNPQFRLSLAGRYDVSDRPGDLMFDTAVLLGRQRARRYQVTPALSVRVKPRTTVTAQYDVTKEALGGDMRGDMYIGRLGVSRMQTARDVWSVTYLGRMFHNGSDMFNPAATERSHTLLVGYNRALAVGTNFSIQGGPRVSTYGNRKPELLTNFTKQHRLGRVGLDYWQGETIIMGIRGPVDIHSFSLKSSWAVRRNIELGAHAGVFSSETLFQGRARVFHPELVASYATGGPMIVAASYGIDFQKGDVRSQLLSDREIVRHVFLVRLTFAPRMTRTTRADPEPRSGGIR